MRLLELILMVGTLVAGAAVALVGLIGWVVWLAGGRAGDKPRRAA